MQYVMALEQGTTSSRCILLDRRGKICTLAQKEFPQIYPHPSRVEHDPAQIWQTVSQLLPAPSTDRTKTKRRHCGAASKMSAFCLCPLYLRRHRTRRFILSAAATRAMWLLPQPVICLRRL